MRNLRWWTLAVVAIAVTVGVARSADPEKPPPVLTAEQKAFDKKVRADLFDVINRGVTLYNDGEWAGCYHLFEGSLRTIEPLLDHHPKLQQLIKDELKEAEEKLPRADQQAYRLREVLDKVRADLKGEATAPVAKTAWDRLGGEKGVAKVIDDFMEIVAADKKVDFTRGGKYKPDEAAFLKLKRHFVELISFVSGGPLLYSGREMKDVHKDMAITSAEFDAAINDLKEAFKKNGAPQADLDLVLKAIEGTRKDIVAPKKPVETPVGKTLWDRLGGEEGVKKVVQDLYDTISKEPKFKRFFDGDSKPTPEQVKKLQEEIVDYISSKTEGPRNYEGKSMKAIHAGMHITEDQFDVFVDYFEGILAHHKVKTEDMKTILDAVKATKKDIVEAKKPDDKPKDKPADDKPKDKPSGDKPKDKPADDKPKDKPATDKPADDKPKDKPTTDKPTDKPADDKSKDKPADDKPKDKPTDDKPKGDKQPVDN